MRRIVAMGAGCLALLVGCAAAPRASAPPDSENAVASADRAPPRDGSAKDSVINLGTIHPARRPPATPSMGASAPAPTTPVATGLLGGEPNGTKNGPAGSVSGGTSHKAGDSKASPKPAPPKPQLAETQSASGQLTAEQVDGAISSQFDGFARCTSAEATVNIRVSVSPDGQVLEATAGRSDPDDAHMRDCVVMALRALQFPKTQSSWPTRLAFDLHLTP